jgi:hypothetical protein
MDFGGMFARLSDLAGDAALVAGDDAQVIHGSSIPTTQAKRICGPTPAAP